MTGCGSRLRLLALLRVYRHDAYWAPICWSRVCQKALWRQRHSQRGSNGERPEGVLQRHQNWENFGAQVAASMLLPQIGLHSLARVSQFAANCRHKPCPPPLTGPGVSKNEACAANESVEEELIYEKLPQDIAQRHVLLMDPILGTGNSASRAIQVRAPRRQQQEPRLSFPWEQ